MKRIIIIAAAILITLPMATNAQRSSSGRKAKEKSSVSRSKVNRSAKARKTVSSQRNSRPSSGKVTRSSRSSSRNEAIRSSKSKRSVNSVRNNAHTRKRVSSSPSGRSRVKSQIHGNKSKRSRNAHYDRPEKRQRINRHHNNRRGNVAKSSDGFRRKYYRSDYNRRIHGHTHGHINHFYRNRKIARNHYHVYHKPSFNIYFRPAWFRFYVDYFPDYHIRYSRELQMIPGNRAYRYIGEVKMVYGKVYETYYDPQNREFFLYFGAPYPNQDFTVVITGRDARKMERRSVRYYIGRDFSVAGLITSFDGAPEVVINDMDQLRKF